MRTVCWAVAYGCGTALVLSIIQTALGYASPESFNPVVAGILIAAGYLVGATDV